MAKLTGADSIAGFKIASTFGTAVQCGADDGFTYDSLSHGTSPGELTNSPKGAGKGMLTDARQGALSPTVTVDGIPTYEDAYAVMIASFMGTSGAGSLQTDGYLHRMTYNKTLQFGTIAWETSTTTAMEYPSAYPSALRLAGGGVPDYLRTSVDFVCGDRELATSVNTNANLASVTQTDTEEIVFQDDTDFWINTDAGALDSNDQVNILSFDLSLARPKEHTREAKGSTGLSAPLTSGLFDGTLTVTLSGLDDHTYFTAAAAGTTYKCKLNFEGTTYGTDNRTFAFYAPLMKLISDPEYNITEDGINSHTLTFKLLEAGSNPTGMNDTKPYFEFINSRSAAYIS